MRHYWKILNPSHKGFKRKFFAQILGSESSWKLFSTPSTILQWKHLLNFLSLYKQLNTMTRFIQKLWVVTISCGFIWSIHISGSKQFPPKVDSFVYVFPCAKCLGNCYCKVVCWAQSGLSVSPLNGQAYRLKNVVQGDLYFLWRSSLILPFLVWGTYPLLGSPNVKDDCLDSDECSVTFFSYIEEGNVIWAQRQWILPLLCQGDRSKRK